MPADYRGHSGNPHSGSILTDYVSKGVLNIDLRRQPCEMAKPLESPQLLFGKPSRIALAISLKIKGKFA
jgi:hypothetical protein